jgi:hypothetical protein
VFTYLDGVINAIADALGRRTPPAPPL